MSRRVGVLQDHDRRAALRLDMDAHQHHCGAVAANPNILMLEVEHGGHCAFLGEPDPRTGEDGYWAELVAQQFVLEHL